MATGSGIVAPGNFPTRDPRRKGQTSGRIVNSTTQYMDVGNFSGPGKWNKSAEFTEVEKPTNVRAAKSVAQRNNGSED